MFRRKAICVLILMSALFPLNVSWAADFPPWLSGEPDLSVVEERSKLYAWVFEQADKQTNGLASKESLARKRLINLSNKLAVHSKATTQKEFFAELTFLVIDDEEPMHFSFFISIETLQRLLPN